MNSQRYAARKRKKPSVFGPKFLIGDGVHNASKRHRDRLNSEMEDLAAALPLPPAAIAKLDKLSVLRLSVGYLRARAFFQELDVTGRASSPSSPSSDQTLTNAIDSSSSSPSVQRMEFTPLSPWKGPSTNERHDPLCDGCRMSPPAVELPLDQPAVTSPLPVPYPASPSQCLSPASDEVTMDKADTPQDLVADAGHAVRARPAAPPLEERGRVLVSCDDSGFPLLPPFPSLVDPEMLLESMSGVLLVVMADGTVFYVSQNIQQYLGFNQTDVILESVFDLIHTDDRATFHSRLCWEEMESPDSGEQSTEATQQQRNFSCRFRCLLDNTSGFMMLRVRGRLKRLHSGKGGSDDTPGTDGGGAALVALATPHHPILPSELRLWNIIFTTKHKLDFTTLSLDSKARLVMGYNAVEFRKRKAVCFQHLGDMLYLKKNNLILMKNGESEPVVFRLLSKQGKWLWVKASARIVYRKGKADFIIATQLLLRDEEGEYYLKNRSPDCVFNVTGEAIAISNSSPTKSQQTKAKLCRSSSGSSQGDSTSSENSSSSSKAGHQPKKNLTNNAKKSAKTKNCNCITVEPTLTSQDIEATYASKSIKEKRDLYHRPMTLLSSLSSSSPESADSLPSECEESLTDSSTLPDDAVGRDGQLGKAEPAGTEDGDRGFLNLLNRHDMTGLDVTDMLGMDAMEALDEGYIMGSGRVSMDEMLEGVLRDMDGTGGRSDEDEALLHPSLSEGLPSSVLMFLQSMDQPNAAHCEQTVPQFSAEGPMPESPSVTQLDIIGGTEMDPSLELPEDLGAIKSTVRALNVCPVWGVIKQRN